MGATHTAIVAKTGTYGENARAIQGSLDREWHAILCHKAWVAVDAGLAVQPANLIALMEGGTIFGVSNALKERITFRGGLVEQTDFFYYPILRMNEAPDVEVAIIESDAPPGGIGEIGAVLAPAALANAFAALTGKRIRDLPLVPKRVEAALG